MLSETKEMLIYLQGFLDGVSTFNKNGRSFGATAFFIGTESTPEKILMEKIRERDEESPLLFVGVRLLEDWVRTLPFVIDNQIPGSPTPEAQEDTSWKIMEIIRVITNDFETKEVSKLEFSSAAEEITFLVIPARDMKLVLQFMLNKA